MMTNMEIICSKCQEPLKGPNNSGPDDRFECPKCGAGDTRDKVYAEAKEYMKEWAARQMQEMIGKTASRSSFITVKSNPIPRGIYRFIARKNDSENDPFLSNKAP